MTTGEKQFKLDLAVQLSARGAIGVAFNSILHDLSEAYDIATADITPLQRTVLDSLFIGLAKQATELVVQNANVEQLERTSWYTGIDWRYAQKLAAANSCQEFAICEFEYKGIAISNPFLDEYNSRPVNPVKHYGEAFLNSEFCRRPQSRE